MPPRLLISATAAAAVVAATLLLNGVASPGAPGSAASPTDSEFDVVGDGNLPDDRPSLREPGAPLSAAERGYAISLALASVAGEARDVLGNARAEVLSADLPPQSQRDDHRRVSVAAYDYRRDRLHQVLLDLTTGRTVSVSAVTDVQPPPSPAETQVALELALTAMPAPAFVDQFRDVTGAPLLAAAQVRVIGVAFTPHHAGSGGAAGDCGSERCLQLLVALPSGTYLSTDDLVVNLSRRAVTLLPAGAQNHG